VSVSGNEAGVVARELSSSCAHELFIRRALPRPLTVSLPAAVLASFAVFHRPALVSDKPPEGLLASELYNTYELESYYPAYVRRLADLAGRRYYVVPAFAHQADEARIECLFRHVDQAKLLAQQHRRAAEALYCFIEVPERRGTDPGCEPFAANEQSARVFGASDFLRDPLVELVPDGVAAVRITYREHPTLTLAVSENAFAFTPPPPAPAAAATLHRLQGRILTGNPTEYNEALAQTDPTKIEWLNRAGRVIRTIRPPTRPSIEATSIGGIRAPIGG
jgi:hypothetical protein